MRNVSLKCISIVVDQFLKDIAPLVMTNTRSYSKDIDGFKFHVSFVDTFNEDTIPDVKAIITLNKSPLCTLIFPKGEVELTLPSSKTVVYHNIVSKMFKIVTQNLGPELIEKIDGQKQETIDIAFGHWVKLEFDPRARSRMRMSYGDDEGTLMSTPVDDPGQSVQYVITSLRGRGESIPYVTPKDKTIKFDLSNFKWD